MGKFLITLGIGTLAAAIYGLATGFLDNAFGINHDDVHDEFTNDLVNNFMEEM